MLSRATYSNCKLRKSVAVAQENISPGEEGGEQLQHQEREVEECVAFAHEVLVLLERQTV